MPDQSMTLRLVHMDDTLELGTGKPLRIISITGIAASDYTIGLQANAQYDGSYVTARRIEPRQIIIEAEYPRDDTGDEMRGRVLRFFNPHDGGSLYINRNGVQRGINYEVQALQMYDENMHYPVHFTVSLVCPNPYWRDVDEFSKNMAGKIPYFMAPFSVFDLPAGTSMSFATMDREAEIINPGDVDTGLVIEFRARGPVSNPRLDNLTTGQYIRILMDMQRGDVLKINTNRGQKRIELNGVNVSNRIDRRSNYIYMQRGRNVLKYDADEGYVNLDVYPRWAPEYLGV